MRSINSPGVQITEKDLSVNPTTPVGTRVLATGFAAEGPTDVILNITTSSELESTLGKPTTPAERYFYNTCKEILNSPASLIVSRLPYGSGAGDLFASAYSALLYPVVSSTSGFTIDQPTHITLDEGEYNAIKQGDFSWSATASIAGASTSIGYVLTSVTVPAGMAGDPALISSVIGVDPDDTFQISFSSDSFGVPVSATLTYETTAIFTNNIGTAAFTSVTKQMSAGIIILNDSQTVINQNFEGYYVSITDNANIGPETNFDSITNIYSLTAANVFYSVPTARLGFALSAEKTFPKDSVSEAIERTQTYYFADDYYRDSLLVNVFKVFRSNNEPQTLSISLAESYAGSLDSTKKELATSGAGKSRSYYLENVINSKSPNITILVNPEISLKTDWVSLTNNNPSKDVRLSSGAKSLFPKGVYKPSYNDGVEKLLGDIPTKVERVLRLVETADTIDLDIVIDGGLSTIHAYKDSVTQVYDDSINQSSAAISTVIESGWRTIFNIFNNFATYVRKDCVFISDPLRNIFVNGTVKTLSKKTTNFTTDIYAHLKQSYAGVNSNYSVTYGNWVKVNDTSLDNLMWVPFSGFAAAIYARTDAVAYPWFAPAGLTRGIVNNINDIGFNPNQKQRDYLYTISVNPVCFFTGDGYAVFGQKTLQVKPSAFDRVNVRRLFLTLEKAVLRVAKYFVFESNTAVTRSRFVNTITPLFELAKNTEGLYDYLIVCDDRNNTPTTIDNNELIVDIYLKPVRTAEFILINFIATRTSQNFSELV